MIKAFQSPSDKTAGDFPGEEIAASDLGLAPHPFFFARQQREGPDRENSSDAAHMFDRTRNSLSPTQEFLERDIIIIEWDDMFMHNALCRNSHYHEERGLSTRVGNFSVRMDPR